MRVWLVTGGSGFIGRHVLTALDQEAANVVALGRRCPPGWDPRRFVVADLNRPETLTRAIEEIQPDSVIHAAGRTPPADADTLFRDNTLSTIHLLDALKLAGKPCRLVIAGSAAEYGQVEIENLPISETHPSRPMDAYGLSKWLATCAAMIATPPGEVISARIFNPIGPGQSLNQAFGKFASQLLGNDTSRLFVGNLEPRRDFIDVRDVAKALIELGRQGIAGQIYNVGTGRSHRVGEGLEHLIRLSGKSVQVRIDSNLLGTLGPIDSRADVCRIFDQTGWQPTISFEQSLNDLWRDAERRSRLPLTA